MSLVLRENSFTAPSTPANPTARQPSHLNSNVHLDRAFDGGGPAVASIGDNGFGGTTTAFPNPPQVNHPAVDGRTVPFGAAPSGHHRVRTSRLSLTCRGPRPVNPRSASSALRG